MFLSRFQSLLISNKWVWWWKRLFWLKNTPTSHSNGSWLWTIFGFFNLSKCGGLTYSLKPGTHADSLSRFVSKRNLRAIGKCQKDWLLYLTMCIFNERLFELTQRATAFRFAERKNEGRVKSIYTKKSFCFIDYSHSWWPWLNSMFLFSLHLFLFSHLLSTFQGLIIRSLKTPTV